MPTKPTGRKERRFGRRAEDVTGRPDGCEIVLICNPKAGGRWKELAEILDSPEARLVRRIVTDSVNDIAPALLELGRSSALLIIYGGDGTIQRILDRISPRRADVLRLALIGGGTMNVTARWCGMSGSPVDNFRAVVRAYRNGNLLLKEVPLLEVQQGGATHRGFTFGMGAIVRVLDAYERGRKGKAAAISIGLRAAAAVFTGRPAELAELVAPMSGEVMLDGERLPYESFIAVFANVTGQINPGVVPFAEERPRDTFYSAAYAVSPPEFVMAMPGLLRGWLPVDPVAMLRPLALRRRARDLLLKRRIAWSRDARYVNRPASRLTVRTNETLYTVDGELMHATPGEPFEVALGPQLKLAVSPLVGLDPAVRLVATASPIPLHR